MAKQIEAGSDVKRADMFIVDPFEVEVREELRGRHTPPSEEDVIALALSILADGQRQPVECRSIAGKRLLLTLGFTRMAAIRLIREGFEWEGEFHQDANFRIKLLVVDCDDQTAFRRNVIENRHRNQTSPVDDAFNMDRLTDRYGYDDKQVAELYRMSTAQVTRIKQLVRLPEEIRSKVHTGVLSVEAALVLEHAPETSRTAILEAATTKNGKVSGPEVKKQVRAHILSDDAKPKTEGPKPAAKPKVIRRSLKDVYDFFSAAALEDSKKATFARALADYIDGKTTDTQFVKAWELL
jgi:ParB-like chromosome segregation protein Spo0J